MTVALDRTPRRDLRATSPRQLLWAALMLGVSLVAIKAYHLGVPLRDGLSNYLVSLFAISYVDVLFAALCWAAARLLLVIAGMRLNRAPTEGESVEPVAVRVPVEPASVLMPSARAIAASYVVPAFPCASKASESVGFVPE